MSGGRTIRPGNAFGGGPWDSRPDADAPRRIVGGIRMV